jgi:hypothetical protein
MDGELNLIEMELREIQVKDDMIGPHIVVLGEKEGPREFPIYIGFAEILALDNALHAVQAERPLTHDLIVNVLQGLGAELKRVIVDDLRHETFFGKLAVRNAAGVEGLIDTRPSDALILACKCRLPIFVAEHVLELVTRDPDEDA